MTTEELFGLLKARFCALPELPPLLEAGDSIEVRPLTPGDILGTAERTDFPVLAGKEIIQQAAFREGRGQAFTGQPVSRTLTLAQLQDLDLSSHREQALFLAGLNAVLHHLGLISDTVHCKDQGPEDCARTATAALQAELRAELGDVKLALIGYQPCLYAHLSGAFPRFRVTDLSPDKIGIRKYGCTVEDGSRVTEEVCAWADVILCTGSTLTNGTFPPFYELAREGRDIRFYGTTVAGAARLLGLKRLCWADANGRPGASRRPRNGGPGLGRLAQ